jgi:hypothetical protein
VRALTSSSAAISMSSADPGFPPVAGKSTTKWDGNRVAKALRNRFEPVIVKTDATGNPADIRVPVTADLVVKSFVGLNPEDSKAIKDAGLALIARIENVSGASPKYIDGTLEAIKANGAEVYLPTGEQVLGHRGAIDATAQALIKYNILYATPEFAKLAGDQKMKEKAIGQVIRLHSLQQAEADKMQPGEVVERFLKASRERSIHWLLLRPTTFAEAKPLDEVGLVVAGLKSRIEQFGGGVKNPRVTEWPKIPSVLFLLIGLAAAPALYWAGKTAFTNRNIGIACGLLGLLGGAACILPGARPYEALLVAIAFPLAAYGMFDREKCHPLATFAGLSAVALAGGLGVAALLNDASYSLQIKQFLGVKAAHFVPILAIGCVLLRHHGGAKKIADKPMLWGSTILSLVLLAAVALMIARTGNDNPEAVSGMELKLRGFLDFVLPVRPRTKEFLIGHPALWVGLCLLAWNRVKAKSETVDTWASVLLLTGAIGQASIVNTMCHLHTPLRIGLTRIAVGLVLGAIIGGVAWMATKRLLERRSGDGG